MRKIEIVVDSCEMLFPTHMSSDTCSAVSVCLEFAILKIILVLNLYCGIFVLKYFVSSQMSVMTQ